MNMYFQDEDANQSFYESSIEPNSNKRSYSCLSATFADEIEENFLNN